MKQELRISESLSLPVESSTWVLAYLAKRGAGKTYCASVQAEEMLKQHIPIVVLDGMGIWYGLRVNRDGKGEGLPIVVFEGEHADLPLVQEKAGEIAAAIVESNISCILDLSDFSKYAAKKIVTEFLNELYRLNRVERHVFIEEADMFCPQKPIGMEEQLCLSAVDNFVRRGGNHNLGCTLITQRSAVLNKNVLTQSDCLVTLRTLAPQDKKAIQEWVEQQTDRDKSGLNKWYDSLKELENGEAYVWHPEKPAIFQRVKFRERETFHATREFIKSSNAANIKLMDVASFVDKFREVFETPKQTQLDSDQTKRLADIKEAGLQDIVRLGEENQLLKKQNEDIKGQINDMGIDYCKLQIETEQLESEKKMQSERIGDLIKQKDDLYSKLEVYKALDNLFSNIVDQQVSNKLTELETRLISKLATQRPINSSSNGETQLIVESNQSELIVKVNRPPVYINENTLRGQLALIFSENLVNEYRSAASIGKILTNLGVDVKALSKETSIFKELDWYTSQRILIRDPARGWKVRDKSRIKAEKQ